MLEIEAKMRLTDATQLRARLRTIDADPGPRIEEVNHFFDTPGQTLRRTDQGLRIRLERHSDRPLPQIIITHKGPRTSSDLKIRPETQLHVADMDDAAQLLGALGYVRVLSFEKRRTRWMLDGCNIELDELPRLGCFIEIEGPDESRVLAVRQKLGLSDEPLIVESYAEMVDQHLSSTNVTEKHLAFEPI